MSLQAFFDNFALLANAPNGVAKLRELILQLAVRGQLATQNPNDERASELFRKIQLHKARLIRNKQIRSSKPLAAIQPSEILFKIPQSWQWIRLGDIGDWGAGATPNRKSSSYYGGQIRWFKSGELNDGHISESQETITDLAFKECSLRLNQPGDVLIAMYGATIGKLAILETEATTNQAVCACTCFDGFYNQFLFVLLRAYKTHFTGRGAGGAQPNISREKIIHTVAPLPPFEEQKRIVAKVDEMMRLCDELEARQQARRESRVRLNSAALAPLNNAASLGTEKFDQASMRLAKNFDALYDSAETVGKLRSTVLQLAVQRKLVPQNDSERVTQGNQVSDYVKIINGYAFKSEWFVKDGIRLLRNANIGHGTLRWEEVATIPLTRADEFSRFALHEGDIVISLDRPIIATGIKVARVSSRDLPSLLLQRVGKFDFKSDELDADYFFMWLHSPGFINAIDPGRSNGVPHISSRSVEAIPFAAPPLKEQKRIVAKANQLMTLCDELETKLRQAEAASEEVMNAAVQHVLDSVRHSFEEHTVVA